MRKAILLAVLLLSASAPLRAGEATIELLQGGAKILSLKTLSSGPAAQGAELFAGDTLVTQPGATAHVRFASGALILVKENASFKVSGLGKKVTVSFDKGEFLIGLVKKLEKDENFEVRTPAAVAGVRGTLFWGLSDEKLTSTFACFESELAISAQGQTQILKPGDKVQIAFGEKPG